MTRRTLNSLLCVSLLLPTMALANSERGVCMPEIQREANRHRAFVIRGLEALEVSMAELDKDIDSMVEGFDDPERLAASLRAIAQEAKPRDAIEEFVEQPVRLLNERYASTSKRSNCPSDLKVSNFLVAFQRSFTTAVLSPAYEVERRLAAERVAEGEGLVVVSFVSNFPFADLVAKRTDGSGEIRVRPKRSGEHFVVVAAKPGTYRWKEIRQSGASMDMDDSDYSFRVSAGHINYVGMLQLEKITGFGIYHYFYDRQAYVLTRVEDRMPELLDRYPVFNGLNPDDLYTEFYLAERQRQADRSD